MNSTKVRSLNSLCNNSQISVKFYIPLYITNFRSQQGLRSVLGLMKICFLFPWKNFNIYSSFPLVHYIRMFNTNFLAASCSFNCGLWTQNWITYSSLTAEGAHISCRENVVVINKGQYVLPSINHHKLQYATTWTITFHIMTLVEPD